MQKGSNVVDGMIIMLDFNSRQKVEQTGLRRLIWIF